MTKKTVISLALAAGCAIALVVPAVQAQRVDTQTLSTPLRVNTGDRAGWLAARNNAESAQYDYLLQISPAFRHARMHKECGPITDPQLRASCLTSFAQYEPFLGSSSRTMANTTRWYPSAGAYNMEQGLTGSSSGTMTTTGMPPYGRDMYGAGAGR